MVLSISIEVKYKQVCLLKVCEYLSQIGGCDVPDLGKRLQYPHKKCVPRAVNFHNPWQDHYYMGFPTQFIHYLACKEAKLPKSGYYTKGSNPPLSCLTVWVRLTFFKLKLCVYSPLNHSPIKGSEGGF